MKNILNRNENFVQNHLLKNQFQITAKSNFTNVADDFPTNNIKHLNVAKLFDCDILIRCLFFVRLLNLLVKTRNKLFLAILEQDGLQSRQTEEQEQLRTIFIVLRASACGTWVYWRGVHRKDNKFPVETARSSQRRLGRVDKQDVG